MIKKILTQQHTPHRLTEVSCEKLSAQKVNKDYAIVDTSLEYQTIIGFGGAFTEASAVTLSKMSPQKRSEVIEKYFDTITGIRYNIGRVHIHSCDFAMGNYTYVKDNDEALTSFSIDHDQELIIPLIKDAMAQRGSTLELLASPWSPPAWMKSNGMMNQGGYLLPKYHAVWAMYYVKFIAAYEEAGIMIWGLTVQNEPEATQTWDSCIYSGEEERDFVKNHLGPTLHNAGYSDKKLLIWDHNRDIIVRRAKCVLDDPAAAQYVWGTGFHWYVSEAFENVGKVHELYPDKHLLFTEGCQEGGVHLGQWKTGERYARNMIGDFNNWCEGYLDWNITLDETGGPNHVGNYCDAPIICDTKTDTLHYNSSYYYIGHFSKYIDQGAKRLLSAVSQLGVYLAAFKNPDNSVIIIIMNENDESLLMTIQVDTDYLNLDLAKHSIVTYVIS